MTVDVNTLRYFNGKEIKALSKREKKAFFFRANKGGHKVLKIS